MTDVVKIEVDVEIVKAAVHAIATAQQVVLDEGATLAQARRFIKLSSSVAQALNAIVAEHENQKAREEAARAADNVAQNPHDSENTGHGQQHD